MKKPAPKAREKDPVTGISYVRMHNGLSEEEILELLREAKAKKTQAELEKSINDKISNV